MEDETQLHYFAQFTQILPDDQMWARTTADTPHSNEVLFDLIKADYEYRLKPREKTQEEKVMKVINDKCYWGMRPDAFTEELYTALKPYLK